jgi:hypothetical protein
MVIRVNHQDTVQAILKSKAIDFNAIGKVIAELGPSVSLAEEPWEDFCLTMRWFIRFYRLPPIGPLGPIADLGELQKISQDLVKG